ncbi:unnamed protein product [Notodromas monacha]|uniref:Uncharacterized protein n=1 Tax=Notodromas monacha TaxID=399045 RepID=A0A7R9BC86_9CRUS|nr:unnamed protein product [Notodromas monacha]CAG0912600.1 unnamed protein product [Notodromas monacha]
MNVSPNGAYSGLGNKVVLITGASSGIGAGAAEVFACHGSSLILCGRNAENLQHTADKCIELGLSPNKIVQVVGDVTMREDLEAYVNKGLEKFGRLDVLVANAGIGVPGNLETLTLEQYELQQLVNTTSVFSLLKLAMPELKKTKGNIVAVSSIAGLRPIDSMLAYSVSKAGMDQMIRCISLEVAKFGVRVNCINPGAIFTNIFTNCGMFGDSKVTFDLVNALASSTHPLGRCGNVYETGKTIAFLASDDASFITGETLRVDGGVGLSQPLFDIPSVQNLI